MSEATFAVGNFSGGEISKFAQGRFDRPDYRNSLKVCLNAFPGEVGTWMRRPGTMHGGFTRSGAAAKIIKFDFEQAVPYTLEFTDGKLRFRNGATLITTGDPQVVVAVSAANPAVVQTTSATTWATGDTLIFPGASTPLLENRQFLVTKIDTTHFSLVDAITGINIDGATLGALVAGATVTRIQELTTTYLGGTWSNIRAVQAETTDILLSPTIAPQALTVTTLPAAGADAAFAINPATFNDGPYLDPFINGVQVTPSAKTGIITLTLSFQTFDSTKAYAIGAFVTSASINYVSLVDQNVGNTPAGSPTFWATTTTNAAINNGAGFSGTDVGRLVRLFSEPVAWSAATTYAASTAAAPVVVSYNPTGLPGAATYWSSLAGSNLNHPPGTDLANWSLVTQAANWSWGKITGLSNIIDRALAGSVTIGDMIQGGGIAAAFDGVLTQVAASSAEKTVIHGPTGNGTPVDLNSYVGKNYSGATDQKIQQAIIYPSSDAGLAGPGEWIDAFSGVNWGLSRQIRLNLRGKATAPANGSDGTLLGTSGTISNTTTPITIVSTDQTTAWKYVWIEQATTGFQGGPGGPASRTTLTSSIAEVSFFSPTGTGATSSISAEILGAPLLYTATIQTWRLGAYSNTTGWPTCGTYYEGRLWLAGAVANRFDACVSNGILGGTVNFAPTDQFGVVAPNNAISYTLNSDSVNPIFWMQPDLQGIIVGTQGGEYLIQAPTNGPLAPNNIAARRATKIGCANVEPRRTEHTTVFVQRYNQKLMEYFADVYSGKFSAPNLADKAAHIVHSGIIDIAYQQGLTPIIWGVCGDGSWFGVTYKRDTLTTAQGPTYAAWHRQSMGSGHIIESICTGPSIGGDLDSLTMVTKDPTTGIRQVEVLTDTMDEVSSIADSWFLDHGIVPTSMVSSPTGLTLNGLWPLNDEPAQVFAGGLDCGDPGEGKPFSDFIVTNGSLFIPYGDGISAGAGRGLFTADFVATNPRIIVGHTYTSRGQLVKPILPGDSGARNGPALGKLTRAHRYAMSLVNTLGLSVGGTFAKLRPAKYETAPAALTLFTGIAQDGANDDDGYDNGWCWEVSRPFPANVVAVALNLNTKDQ